MKAGTSFLKSVTRRIFIRSTACDFKEVSRNLICNFSTIVKPNIVKTVSADTKSINV